MDSASEPITTPSVVDDASSVYNLERPASPSYVSTRAVCCIHILCLQQLSRLDRVLNKETLAGERSLNQAVGFPLVYNP